MNALTKIRIFPTGMRLHEWIAFEEGYFRAEGLDPEVMWDVYHGQIKAWTGGYKARPQDQPFLEGTQAIGNACAWGSVCNAGAGMGKFVPDAYGVARRPSRRASRGRADGGQPLQRALPAREVPAARGYQDRAGQRLRAPGRSSAEGRGGGGESPRPSDLHGRGAGLAKDPRRRVQHALVGGRGKRAGRPAVLLHGARARR